MELDTYQGPLLTRAKSHDHETVGAQKESVQRPCQHTSKTMERTGKSYVTGPSTKCYFDEILVKQILTQ